MGQLKEPIKKLMSPKAPEEQPAPTTSPDKISSPVAYSQLGTIYQQAVEKMYPEGRKLSQREDALRKQVLRDITHWLEKNGFIRGKPHR